jgi:hypothetical protein
MSAMPSASMAHIANTVGPSAIVTRWGSRHGRERVRRVDAALLVETDQVPSCSSRSSTSGSRPPGATLASVARSGARPVVAKLRRIAL